MEVCHIRWLLVVIDQDTSEFSLESLKEVEVLGLAPDSAYPNV